VPKILEVIVLLKNNPENYSKTNKFFFEVVIFFKKNIYFTM